GVHLPLRFLGTHLGTRFGALGLLRCRRLSLHLPLRILRRGGNLSADAVHGACRRMLLAVIAGAHRLAGTLRCRSRPCILRVCGAAGGVTWASQCGAGAQHNNRAAREKESLDVHLRLLACILLKAPVYGTEGNRRVGCKFQEAALNLAFIRRSKAARSGRLLPSLRAERTTGRAVAG